ncbi:hypothetical protein [uncultured Psychroserpens sp.]|uniref:hypothetical protein n=1 Tax=uncultured Psychroserpens sp. TaxID=255436 RepID=UPI00261151C5|nr:hypothetical protein [uncultured Psychroserpens sp.]
MEFIYKILRQYPEIGTLFIATTFTALGFIFKTLIDTFLENKKHRNEIRKLYWTERISAAKKASEYYFDLLELIGLMIHKIDIVLNHNEPSSLENVMHETIEKISQRSVNPSTFEHHHIHIFYNFDSEVFDKLNTESFDLIKKLETTHISETDSNETIDKKLNQMKSILVSLKANHETKKDLYKKYLNKINEDLSEFVK